ncbi:hypothetical protein [Lutibacter citreus]|uniref:hypothetical protein n=1 Tax=Lutibacter citreus TaxID=2138210 RepID=UPI000DBE885C|nr:hypothetical protein [Lutibacter citreus]
MKKNILVNKYTFFKDSILHLQDETTEWISEIKFIAVEQNFLKEMLESYILKFCRGDRFNKAKLLLNSLNIEGEFDEQLQESLREHRVNLALLIEDIYLKKEEDFRENHKQLRLEVSNYIQNFRCIKEQVFELTLLVMKIEKQKEAITK